MEQDLAIAVGSALTALGELLERKGICTTTELAVALADKAMAAEGAGPEAMRRAGYLGAWAYLVRLSADGVGIDDY